MTGQPVRRERAGDVLVITIDNPPVNASTAAVRSGLLDAIGELAQEPSLRGGVLMGAGGTFVAGSDVAEFEGAVPDPLLPVLLAAIEGCSKPVVAAIAGFALGGGFELALACDRRILASDAVVGLPEVTLGMVPGAGGTQRLPRLTGRAWALEAIVTGRRVSAEEAVNVGAADEVVSAGCLRERGVELARVVPKRRAADLDPPAEEDDRLNAVAARVLKAGRCRPEAVEAERLVRSAGRVPLRDALRDERAVFDRLRLGEESRALRHMSFAERAAARSVLDRTSRPAPVSTIGVVGGGSMGTGIAVALARSDFDVVLVDRDEQAADAAAQRANDLLASAVRRGQLSSKRAQAIGARITTSGRVESVAGSGLVIEAVFEDAEVKAALLPRLEEVTGGAAFLATNTSYLDVDAMAEHLHKPERLIGLHFFNPAHVMRLVEVVQGRHSSPAAVEAGIDVVRRSGKQPVVTGAQPGFVGNRIFSAYRRQAEYLLEDGALPWQVDASAVAFGFAMGPFAVADLSGLQIAWTMRQEQRRQGRLPRRYVDVPDRLCEEGRLGRRTGAGYYSYPSGGAAQADAGVEQLIRAESARKGIERALLTDEQILARLLFGMVAEACTVLAEGVAARAGDVDVVMVNGFGFPRHCGGPLWWASRQEEGAVITGLASAAAAAAVPVDVDGVLRVLRAVRADA
jgi:3-hydroxyacyl-CoA dehydrogenase